MVSRQTPEKIIQKYNDKNNENYALENIYLTQKKV